MKFGNKSSNKEIFEGYILAAHGEAMNKKNCSHLEPTESLENKDSLFSGLMGSRN